MKDNSKNQWRSVVRKLKAAKRKRERLTEPDELRDINLTISVLELKEERLRPKRLKP